MHVSDIETKKYLRLTLYQNVFQPKTHVTLYVVKCPLHLSVPSNIRDTKWVEINYDSYFYDFN